MMIIIISGLFLTIVQHQLLLLRVTSGDLIPPICNACPFGRRLLQTDVFPDSDIAEVMLCSQLEKNSSTEQHIQSRNTQNNNDGNNDDNSTATTNMKSLLDGGDACSRECQKGIEFCGKDNNCYKISCGNFYKYGNSYYSGVDEDTIDPPIKLTCQSIDLMTQTIDAHFPVSTIYGCRDNFDSPPRCLANNESAKYGLWFSQRCSANVDENHDFTCYDLEHNSTDFETYQSITTDSTMAGNGMGCEDDEVPKYEYAVHVIRREEELESGKLSISCSDNSIVPMSSTTFNESLAYGTISVMLKVGNYVPENSSATDSPTAAPGTPSLAIKSQSFLPIVFPILSLALGFVI